MRCLQFSNFQGRLLQVRRAEARSLVIEAPRQPPAPAPQYRVPPTSPPAALRAILTLALAVVGCAVVRASVVLPVTGRGPFQLFFGVALLLAALGLWAKTAVAKASGAAALAFSCAVVEGMLIHAESKFVIFMVACAALSVLVLLSAPRRQSRRKPKTQ